MNREEENYVKLKEVRQLIEGPYMPGDKILTTLKIQVLLDISKSLAVIADKLSEGR